jgi:hypothetical protein
LRSDLSQKLTDQAEKELKKCVRGKAVFGSFYNLISMVVSQATYQVAFLGFVTFIGQSSAFKST